MKVRSFHLYLFRYYKRVARRPPLYIHTSYISESPGYMTKISNLIQIGLRVWSVDCKILHRLQLSNNQLKTDIFAKTGHRFLTQHNFLYTCWRNQVTNERTFCYQQFCFSFLPKFMISYLIPKICTTIFILRKIINTLEVYIYVLIHLIILFKCLRIHLHLFQCAVSLYINGAMSLCRLRALGLIRAQIPM